MSWDIASSNGNETAKIRNRVAIYLCGRGLDLGCGPWKVSESRSLANECIGVDLMPGSDVIWDIGHLDCFSDERFDYVYSSHALEDEFYTEPVLKEWWRLVQPGGYLILYLPLTKKVAKELGREDWEHFYPNMGEEGANPNHKQDLNPMEIDKIIEHNGHARLEVDEIRCEKEEYSVLKVFRKLSTIKTHVRGLERPDPKQKRALVVRYGAFGDQIQSTPVFRLLKERGYHVTVNCTPMGADVIKHNPNVDDYALQLQEIVPNSQLKEYWEEMAKHYDLFVNLTGAVEDNLLKPDRAMYKAIDILRKKAPDATEVQLFEKVVEQFRKEIGGSNYYDEHLKKAGLSERGLNGELYFSEDEEIVAHDFRQRHKGAFLILWSLSGSAYHKLYPYFQQVVQKVLLEIPEALVISVGDERCIPMERVASPRYLPRAAVWPIRQSLIMTKYVDCVVGSETGVLNAAGCFPTPKITLLSHSSHENLCQYWENDFCLAPEDTFCHPCHMLHYLHPRDGKTECKTCSTVHETLEGTARDMTPSCPMGRDLTVLDDKEAGIYPLCVAQGIHPDRVVARVKEVYVLWCKARGKESSKTLEIRETVNA